MPTDFSFSIEDLMNTSTDPFKREQTKNLLNGKPLQTSGCFKITGTFNPSAGANLLSAGEMMMGPGIAFSQASITKQAIDNASSAASINVNELATAVGAANNPSANGSGGSTSTGSGGTLSTVLPANANNAQKIPVVIGVAQTQLGVPYIYGGETPKTANSSGGFDCSGLMQYCFSKVNVTLPRVAQDQINATLVTPMPALTDLLPGDLIGYSYSGTASAPVGHIALHIGYGMQIDAPSPGGVVHQVPIDPTAIIAIGRPLPVPPAAAGQSSTSTSESTSESTSTTTVNPSNPFNVVPLT